MKGYTYIFCLFDNNKSFEKTSVCRSKRSSAAHSCTGLPTVVTRVLSSSYVYSVYTAVQHVFSWPASPLRVHYHRVRHLLTSNLYTCLPTCCRYNYIPCAHNFKCHSRPHFDTRRAKIVHVLYRTRFGFRPIFLFLFPRISPHVYTFELKTLAVVTRSCSYAFSVRLDQTTTTMTTVQRVIIPCSPR